MHEFDLILYDTVRLGGNRVGPSRVYINLLIVMGLGGLWHGASWNYMVWGLAHGVMLCIHRVWTTHVKSSIHLPAALRHLGTVTASVLTFLCVMLAWVPFRATEFATTQLIFGQLFSSRGLSVAGADLHFWVLLAFCVGWCVFDRARRVQDWLVNRLAYPLVGVPIGIALIGIELFGQYDLQIPFIYFKF